MDTIRGLRRGDPQVETPRIPYRRKALNPAPEPAATALRSTRARRSTFERRRRHAWRLRSAPTLPQLGENEWYTPSHPPSSRRPEPSVGGISSDANERVKAAQAFTSRTKGLAQRWDGKVLDRYAGTCSWSGDRCQAALSKPPRARELLRPETAFAYWMEANAVPTGRQRGRCAGPWTRKPADGWHGGDLAGRHCDHDREAPTHRPSCLTMRPANPRIGTTASVRRRS